MKPGEREVSEGSLIACPKCCVVPTNLIQRQRLNNAQWVIEIIWRECPNCEHVWNREPPLKPWEVE